MQSLLKMLVVVIFVISTLAFGVSLMFVYTTKSAQNDVSKKLSEMKNKTSQATAKLKELTDARGKGGLAEQGIEFLEGEVGKSTNANERRETKEYPEMLLALTTQYSQDQTKFQKTEEENLKAGERTLADKQRTLKDLRTKVQQARVERDKAAADIKALEAQKVELRNRTSQSTILLSDVRRRHEEVTAQIEAAKKASAGASR